MSEAYFISGASYLRWEVGGGQIDAGYPKPLSHGWSGIDGTGFDQGVDASVDLGKGKLYLFNGGSYIRIDNATNSAEGGATSIADKWPGMAAAGFADSLDAAVNHGDGRVFFFRGDQYLAYDIEADAVAGSPMSIAADWGGLADAGFGEALDAAVNWGTGVIYFFRGDQYVTYDIAQDTTSGPTSVAADWTGFGDVGFVPVSTAWVKLAAGAATPTPVGPASGGDCIWFFNGQVSTGPDLPRLRWFPTSTSATDYLGHGDEIFQFVVHSDGTILRGRPHMRNRPGSFAWLNRNPGNIMAGGGAYGQYPGKVNWHKFMIFPSHDIGFAAIGKLLRGPGYANLSVLDAFRRYAPASDGNNPDQYAADVAAAAGVPSSTIISTLSDDQLLLVQQKIEAIEGSVPGDTLTVDSPDLPPEVRALIP